MYTFSVWEFTKFNELSQVIELLKINKERKIKVESEKWIYDDLLLLIQEIEGFGLNNVKVANINDININYVFFEGYVEKAKREYYWFDEDNNIKSKQDITNHVSYKILLFECNKAVKGIFFCSKSNASNMISSLFDSKVLWGEITPYNFSMTDDLLYWLFQRVKDYPEESLSKDINISVTGLQSYKGSSKDQINVMKGEGNRISAMLGTLAFLFNNEQLRSVSPEVVYNGHKILLELSLVGTYKIWENTYMGDLVDNNSTVTLCNIIILVVTKIIPQLIKCYTDCVQEGVWSPQVKLYFLKSLGTEITNRVNSELNKIRKEIQDNDLNEEDDIEILN